MFTYCLHIAETQTHGLICNSVDTGTVHTKATYTMQSVFNSSMLNCNKYG